MSWPIPGISRLGGELSARAGGAMTDPTVGSYRRPARFEVAADEFLSARSLYVTYGLKYRPSSRIISKVPSARI